MCTFLCHSVQRGCVEVVLHDLDFFVWALLMRVPTAYLKIEDHTDTPVLILSCKWNFMRNVRMNNIKIIGSFLVECNQTCYNYKCIM